MAGRASTTCDVAWHTVVRRLGAQPYQLGALAFGACLVASLVALVIRGLPIGGEAPLILVSSALIGMGISGGALIWSLWNSPWADKDRWTV